MEREWTLKRNCSLTPRQLGAAYLVLCAGAFAVALAFAVRGIWFVLGFAVAELALVGVALLRYSRHALDRERIALSERSLIVEKMLGGRTEQVRLDPHWTRIAVPDRRRALIELESCGVTVAVGEFVNDATRRQVALELRRELRSSSYLA